MLGLQEERNYIYGTEYQTHGSDDPKPPAFHDLLDQDVPRSVCYTPLRSVTS